MTAAPWLEDEAVRDRLRSVRLLIEFAYEQGFREMGFKPDEALAEAAYRAGVEAAARVCAREESDPPMETTPEWAEGWMMACSDCEDLVRALLPPSPPRSRELRSGRSEEER